MAEEVLPGIGGLLVTFAIINSSLANANAGAIASTRSIFSLGRGRLLPEWFAAVHPVHRTPVNAVHFQGVLAIVLAVGLGLLFAGVSTGGPLTTYVFIGYALGLLFAGMYIAVNVAAIGFYLGERRDEFNVLKHLLVPILGVLLMIPAFLSVLGGLTIPLINVEVPALTEPYSYVPPLVAVWMVAGVVLYFFLRSRNPDAIAKIGAVMGESRELARSIRLVEDRQRAVGRDDEVRHVHDLADPQVDADAAQQVGVDRREAVLATEPVDHPADGVAGRDPQVRPDAVGRVAAADAELGRGPGRRQELGRRQVQVLAHGQPERGDASGSRWRSRRPRRRPGSRGRRRAHRRRPGMEDRQEERRPGDQVPGVHVAAVDVGRDRRTRALGRRHADLAAERGDRDSDPGQELGPAADLGSRVIAGRGRGSRRRAGRSRGWPRSSPSRRAGSRAGRSGGCRRVRHLRPRPDR